MDLLTGRLVVVHIRAQDIVVGHHQAIAAAERIQGGELFHGQSGLLPAGADSERKGVCFFQGLHEVQHGLRHAPGIDGKHQPDLPLIPNLRCFLKPGNIPGLIAGKSRDLLRRPPGIPGTRKIKNHGISTSYRFIGIAAPPAIFPAAIRQGHLSPGWRPPGRQGRCPA